MWGNANKTFRKEKVQKKISAKWGELRVRLRESNVNTLSSNYFTELLDIIHKPLFPSHQVMD